MTRPPCSLWRRRMLHPERHGSQRRVCGQSQWLLVLCNTLSFSFPSRFIQALSLTHNRLTPSRRTPKKPLPKNFFAKRFGKLGSRQMKTAVKPATPARTPFSGAIFISESQFSVFQLYSISALPKLPFSPPSGLAQRLLQEPTAESKFLAVSVSLT